MESPQRAFSRLADALETLVCREASQVLCRDYNGVAETQRRSSAIVARLAELGADCADTRSRAKIQRLAAVRQRTIEMVSTQMCDVREALVRTRESRGRITQIAPAYGALSHAGNQSRLCALG